MESILLVLQIAFLGFFAGVILNFMPCVLPLIAIKIAGFSNTKTKQDAKIISITTTLGILTFCLVLAGIFSTFNNLYWGFQLQFPSVIAFLIFTFVVLFAVVLGLIDINPKFHIKKLKSKALEGFVSGFLIVIFSLSCVAPIVASAVSFAFTFKHSYVIFVCLFFMGIGLSLPYILAGFFGLKFSMKNGGIGEKVIKFVSGLSVILTLFYLMTVLRSQVGNVLTILVFGMSVAFAFLVYRFRAVLTFVIGAVLIVTLPFFTKMEQKLEVQASVPFSLQNIEKYLSSGHTIFLNVEASWCITCKTNEVSAFGTQDFKSYLSKNNIIYMKADLTIKNKEVEDFVKSFGGFGVPFYLIFAGNEREHKILPLLLTSGTLINEIEEFKNKYAYKRGK